MRTNPLKRLFALALAVILVLPLIPTPKAEAAGYEESLLPNMGWSSWNNYANHITEEICIEQMNLMVELGLYDLGYNYFNIDDGYQMGRSEETGLVIANTEKFPNGMKYIADYAHSLGMKAGIYSDVGDNTCASRANGEGSSDYQNNPGTGYGLGVGLYQHDDEDLRQYFDTWGYDFLKVDWCGGQNVGWNNAERIERYIEVGEKIEALRQELGRDLMYNVCCWTFLWDDNGSSESTVMNNIESSYADSWRTGGDLWADFGSVLSQIDKIKGIEKYSGPGYHHDLDMLQVGRGLTYEEDVTHFSMWCMMSSPLMIGADLSKISDEALSILMNEEMIAIDQDPAGLCAVYKKTVNSVEYWVKDLGEKDSTTKAIALMNRSDSAQTVTVTWSDYALNGKVTVRDLWQHKYLNVGDSYTVTIPAHGTVVYKVEAESTSADTGVIVNGIADISFGEKEATMNLTELGSGDWIHYGNANDGTTRRKANVTTQVDYTGNLLGELNATDCYGDAATAYSWTDGTDGSASGITSGMTVGKSVGSYGQVDAVADERERTLYVPITGWQSDIKVEVYLGGKLMGEQTFTAETAADGQPRVNKMVTVTYSAESATTLSVKWTVTAQHNGKNGNTAFEAAALTAVDGDVIGLYPSGASEEQTNYIGGYTAKEKVANGAVLIDVRSASEYAAGHIDGAVNIPWSASFVDTVKEMYPDTNTEIIVYCLTGKRSYQSRDALQYNGYTNVWDMGSKEHWDAVPELVFTDYSAMIFDDTELTISVYGAENDDVELRYSIGETSTVRNSVAYTGPFTLGQGGDVTVKAYLLFNGEVVAENSYTYLVFKDEVPTLSGTVTYLSDLTPTYSYVGTGSLGKDQSLNGKTMTIAGRTFSKGISTHAPSEVIYNIPDGATRFVAAAGMDDDRTSSNPIYSVVYSVYIDGVKMDRTVVLPGSCFYVFDIVVPEGAKELKLVCEMGNSSTHKDHNMDSEWGIAAFTYDARPVVSTLEGDVNFDNVVNVVDIIQAKRLIINGSWTDAELNNGDLDGDGKLTVTDMVEIKNLILKG